MSVWRAPAEQCRSEGSRSEARTRTPERKPLVTWGFSK
jgi:hypothetical protein